MVLGLTTGVRKVGLSCIPGLTLVSLLDRVEGCYKRQPLWLEAISHTRDAHFRNIRGRSSKQTNKLEISKAKTLRPFMIIFGPLQAPDLYVITQEAPDICEIV